MCIRDSALFFHDFYFALYDIFFQFHVGYSVHEQAADTIGAFVNGDCMAAFVELVGGCQAGGAASYDLSLIHI